VCGYFGIIAAQPGCLPGQTARFDPRRPSLLLNQAPPGRSVKIVWYAFCSSSATGMQNSKYAEIKLFGPAVIVWAFYVPSFRLGFLHG
jgi:hypothetical protein